MWKSVITLFVGVSLMMFNTQARSITTEGLTIINDTSGVSSALPVQSSLEQNEIPDHFEVQQNYPNPFNGTTTIEYILPDEAGVFAVVYNILGHRIKTLKDELQNEGKYKMKWDGTSDNGQEVASGMYFYVLVADDNYSFGKMLLIK